MAHLTNFSFELFYEIFTEDASPFFLYHGAKKSKMTKNSNQGGGGPALMSLVFKAILNFIEKKLFFAILRHFSIACHVGNQDYSQLALRKTQNFGARIRYSQLVKLRFDRSCSAGLNTYLQK